VFWLFAGNKTAMLNLQKEAERRGVAASRLVFAERAPLHDHLARHSLHEYESLAYELATRSDKPTGIRSALAVNRQNHPLFDTELFTRHIEMAYINMHERRLLKLPPDYIDIQV
jgi:predicted O-linked N-acetylglucosamine transferase (SPINDLY family)